MKICTQLLFTAIFTFCACAVKRARLWRTGLTWPDLRLGWATLWKKYTYRNLEVESNLCAPTAPGKVYRHEDKKINGQWWNPVCHIRMCNCKSWSWKVRLSGGKKVFNALIVVPRCLPYLSVCPLSWPNKVSLSHPKASQSRAAPETTNARKPFCTSFPVVERHPIRNRKGGEGGVESCKGKEMHENKNVEGGLSSNTPKHQSWSITKGWPNCEPTWSNSCHPKIYPWQTGTMLPKTPTNYPNNIKQYKNQ